MTQKNIQCLRDTQRLLLPDELEQCVELVEKARMVLLFGIGSDVYKRQFLPYGTLTVVCRTFL